ncbi:hypothetical protein [Pseudogemmobacter bohemicus]|uniref:hypothetical protein n=1 Tax=Pseudogemmobacter bohemicus TaxID=2250708 RepID=UPI000DD33837|nr:hypothetical protein [Pseudogemmobacter bohemicus]
MNRREVLIAAVAAPMVAYLPAVAGEEEVSERDAQDFANHVCCLGDRGRADLVAYMRGMPDCTPAWYDLADVIDRLNHRHAGRA